MTTAAAPAPAFTVTPSNGTPTPDIRPGPSPGELARQRVRTHRASALAEFTGQRAADPDPTPAPTPAPAEPAKEPAPEVPTEPARAPAADPAPEPAAADAETARRLATVQAAEKRSRAAIAAEQQKLAAEREAFAKERAAIEADRAELARLKKLADRAKVDPASALRGLGVEDMEYAARQAYAAAKADPTNKAAAAEAMRLREQADELAEIRETMKAQAKELADWKSQSAAEREQAHAAQAAEAFMSSLKTAVTTGKIGDAPVNTPLARYFLAKNPAGADRALRQAAYDLLTETGDVPDAADVLARYEQTRRAELLADGFDPDALVKAGAPTMTATKVNDQAAGKKLPAPTLGNDLSTPRVPRRYLGERANREETLGLLEAGKTE